MALEPKELERSEELSKRNTELVYNRILAEEILRNQIACPTLQQPCEYTLSQRIVDLVRCNGKSKRCDMI